MEFPGNFIGTQNTANTNYLSGVHSLYEVGQGVSDGTWPTNYKINQSLRFNGSEHLSKSFGSANRETFTFSSWVKLVGLDSQQDLFGGGPSSDQLHIQFTTDNRFGIRKYTSASGGNTIAVYADRILRDLSSWYHLMVSVDTTQTIDSNKIKIYINGVEQAVVNSTGGVVNWPSTNEEVSILDTMYIGRRAHSNDYLFSGYIAEYNFIDGLALDASYFGFTNPTTQKWSPKRYTGEYGSTGFYLDFAGTNTGTGAVGTVGEDKSGNGNHFTSSGIASHDVVPDSPTNNFATFNTTWRNYVSGRTGVPVYKEGNLKADGTGASNASDAMTEGTLAVPINGKWYFEAVTYGDTMVGWGVPFEGAAAAAPGYNTRGFGFHKDGQVKYNSVNTYDTGFGNLGSTEYTGELVRVFLDLDNFQITFGRDGTWGTTDPIPDLGNYESLIPIFRATNAADNDTHVNFGQDATFAGAKTPTQVYTDANGLGKFFYEPPAGALAICSENIDKVKNQPTTYEFDETNKHIITYNGNARVSKFSPYATDGYSFTGVSTKELNISKDAFTFGTGSFSFECWAYPDAHDGTNYQVILDSRASATAVPLVFGITQNGYPYWYNGTEYAGSIKTNPKQWNHIVYARDTSEGVLKIYLNGTQVYSSTSFNSTNLSGTTTGTAVIGQAVQNIGYVRGHLSDLRVVKGSSAYDISGTTISVPTKPLEVITNTSLLISSTKNRFLDLSTNEYAIVTDGPAISDYSPYAKPNTVTQDLSIAGGSFYFDGSGDYIWIDDSADFHLSNNDFTIECWAYFKNTGAKVSISGQANSGGQDTSTGHYLYRHTDNKIRFAAYTGSGTTAPIYDSGTTTVSANQWYHLAVVRYNDTLSIYIDGVSTSSTDVTGISYFNSTNKFSLGSVGEYVASLTMNGYISDYRFVKGAAVYQGNFTPPTAPLTQTSKTKLLLQPYSKVKQDDSVFKNIDNYNQDEIGGKLTHIGSRAVDTSPYSKGDDIGSLYFDGTDDELLLPTISAVGTSDFTIEMWFKELTDSNATYDGFLSLYAQNPDGTAGSTTHRVQLAVHNGVLHYYSGNWYSTGWSPTTGKWHHVAFVRDYSAPTFKLYVDGTEEHSTASVIANKDFNVNWSGTVTRMGAHTGYNNYLATDVRITKQALYTGAFTTPKYPFTSDKYVTDGTNQSATGPSTTTTYTVTVASGTKYDGTTGNRYVIDGEPFETVTLHRGSTYRFDVSDSSFGSNAHPFRFSSNENNSPSAAYTTGVTVSGDGGSADAYVEIVVANDAPDNLYYYCTNHSGMGGTIKVEGGRTITADSVVLHLQPGKKEQKSEVFEFASLIKNNYSGTAITLANNGYSVTSTAIQSVHSSFSVSSGKWYVEASGTSGTAGGYIGVQEANTASPAPTYSVTLSAAASQGIGLWPPAGNIYGGNGTSAISAISAPGTAIASTDVVAMAIDMDASPKTVQWLVNNTRVITVKLGSTEYIAADGTTGTATATFADISNLYVTYNGGTNNTRTGDWNFGQDPTIGGHVTPSGGTNADNGFPDEDGRGSFRYAPPAGYKAMGRLQKPAQVVSNAGQHPENYFNTLLYMGNGGTQSITGLDFKPDFVWIKKRSSAANHMVYDSNRGPNRHLHTNTDDEEVLDTDGLSSFNIDGFTLDGANGNTNTGGVTYVAWCWKAGDTIVPNTNGTIPSVVSVNKDAGFSIVKYTGNGTAGATIGHGLKSTPEMVIYKNLDTSTTEWPVYVKFITNGYKLKLHINDNERTTSNFNSTDPTNDVLTVGTGNNINAIHNHYIAYCWHSVPGYSKIGKYVGNGNADGPFVYTGFKPVFILQKNATTDNTAWQIWDSVRSNVNPNQKILSADTTAAESTTSAVDFLSNGFKVRNDGSSTNTSSATCIYLAFAEAPFTRTSAK